MQISKKENKEKYFWMEGNSKQDVGTIYVCFTQESSFRFPRI